MARRDLTGAVDFSYLETYAGGDLTIVEEVLGLFCEQVSLWVRVMDPHAPEQGWRDGAHTLKGTALSIGAGALAQACADAEAATKDGPVGKTALLHRVHDAVDAALADISAYRHELALKSLKG
jgi:HPt (histidine-containing phosphotransfer) domain-containing protein